MARRLGRLLLATIAWVALSRPAIATPDDSSGRARVLAVGSDQERIVVGVASGWDGEWSEISVFALPSRTKIRSLPLPAAGDTPSSWLQWARDALGSPTTLEAPRASRVSPDRTHFVTVTQRFDDGPSPHYTVAVDLVSTGGRTTVLRRRIARGCAPDRLPQRPLDVEATWIGARTVVLTGSFVARCGVFNDVEPLLELVSVRPRVRALPTARLAGLLRREAARLDTHGYGNIADRAALLTEAVELSPRDGELRVERTAALLERGRLDRDGVLTQLLDVLAIGDKGAYQALERARDLEVFEPLADDPSIQRLLEPVVYAQGVHRGHRWRAECRTDLGCAIRRDGVIDVYVSRRGSWACSEQAGVLACIHTHTTSIDLQEGWLVRLGRGHARQLAIPLAGGRVLGSPRITDDALELDTEGSPTPSMIPLDR